ncbi:GTPase Era, mitochondrial [Xylocopa sonorina]|uniref:GTPase Era, mitochondrial n=1 Tax=Xylocopa sonorina TaxID=1818115 RepID=UPI00403B2E97
MLFTIEKCVYRLELSLLRRSFFYSATRNINDNQEEVESEYSNNSKLQQGNRKLLKFAILGLPNAGKSTLVNKLARRTVCPASSKVHTTQHKAEAIYTEGDTQIVFMDTPGITTSKEIKTYNLLETFKTDPEISVNEADVIGILQDVTNVHFRHKFDNYFLDYLNSKRKDAQLLLILNKVDKLKKKAALLEIVRILTENEKYPKFDDIFMVSALSGDGVDDLRNYLVDSAKAKDWKYEDECYTDQSSEQLIVQTVRARLLDILPSEMPYKVKVQLEDINFGHDGTISSTVLLDCPAVRYVTILLKHKAFKIKCLAFHVEKELRHAFRTAVIVRINVQCTKKNQSK